MSGDPGPRVRFWLVPLVLLTSTVPRAEAGGRFFRKGSTAVPTVQAVPVPPQSHGTLGTFSRSPYIFVRGNGTAGGGYSPLAQFGDATMVLYGPISSLRMTSAPILTYTRGYDGRTVVAPGTSFSTPNLPALTPVIYPTQANEFYGFRRSATPPWWQNAMNWIDQN
jgi:hypothetical protein